MKTTELEKGQEIQFLGFNIKNCLNNDGIVLSHPDAGAKMPFGYHHLGNYSSLKQAQKYAIQYFMIARPEVFGTQISRYINGSDTWGSYSVFKDQVLKEGFELPEGMYSDESLCLLFNGERINAGSRLAQDVKEVINALKGCAEALKDGFPEGSIVGLQAKSALELFRNCKSLNR